MCAVSKVTSDATHPSLVGSVKPDASHRGIARSDARSLGGASGGAGAPAWALCVVKLVKRDPNPFSHRHVK